MTSEQQSLQESWQAVPQHEEQEQEQSTGVPVMAVPVAAAAERDAAAEQVSHDGEVIADQVFQIRGSKADCARVMAVPVAARAAEFAVIKGESNSTGGAGDDGDDGGRWMARSEVVAAAKSTGVGAGAFRQDSSSNGTLRGAGSGAGKCRPEDFDGNAQRAARAEAGGDDPSGRASPSSQAPMPTMDTANFRGLDTFALNVMVVGESGLGKTTFLHAIRSCLPGGNGEQQSHGRGKTVGEPTVIYTHKYEDHSTTRPSTFKFSAVDAAGFEVVEGEHANTEANFKPIMQYILNKQDVWDHSTDGDGNADRPDERIHLLFYFIKSNRVKDIDLSFMEQFANVVPIIPIIAQADTLTRTELEEQLSELEEKIRERSICTCRFNEDLASWMSCNEDLRSCQLAIPRKPDIFAVITAEPGATRKYAWGTAEPNNELHSDFRRLVGLLFGESCVHLQEILQNAKDLANSRIKGKTWTEKWIAGHPWAPGVCFTMGVVFLTLTFGLHFAEYTVVSICCGLIACAAFPLAFYAQREQNLGRTF